MGVRQCGRLALSNREPFSQIVGTAFSVVRKHLGRYYDVAARVISQLGNRNDANDGIFPQKRGSSSGVWFPT